MIAVNAIFPRGGYLLGCVYNDNGNYNASGNDNNGITCVG